MLMHHCLAAASPRSKLEDWSNMTDSLQDIVALQDQAAFSPCVHATEYLFYLRHCSHSTL